MTDKERSEQRQLINDILGVFVERMEGQFETMSVRFEVLDVKLEAIKEQTTKTNGRVSKHDIELIAINKAEILHPINCPHGKSIEELLTIKKNWKVYAISGLVIGFLAIASALTVYESAKDLFKADVKIEQSVKSVQDVNKVQDKKIDNNKKAINDQAVDKAFQESLDE